MYVIKNRLLQAVISGAIVGLIVGVAFQMGRESRHDRAIQQIIEEFAPSSPPLLVDMLKPEAVPIASCLLFASLGALTWLTWSRVKR